LALCIQTSARSGTPDCLVVHRTVSGPPGWSAVNSPLSGFDGNVRLKFTGLSSGLSAANSLLSGMKKGDMAIIHRTVRWCTGLFGEPTVASANSRPHNLCATRGRANGRLGTPDSVRCANRSQGPTVDSARFGRQSRTGQATVAARWRTGLSGAPLDRRQGWPSKFASNGS
jgi:hypothetical protein